MKSVLLVICLFQKITPLYNHLDIYGVCRVNTGYGKTMIPFVLHVLLLSYSVLLLYIKISCKYVIIGQEYEPSNKLFIDILKP